MVNALGTVTPLATVTVQTQISGQLISVGFTEGQLVNKGDFLAQIDARPYEIAKAQAEGQLAHDQGLLAQAQTDLKRYQGLLAQNSIARQQADDQAFLVQQDEGTVKLDQAQVDAQALNIAYCHIVSPVTGRIGLRLVEFHGAFVLLDQVGLIVGLLARDRILRQQPLIALEIGLCLRQQPLIVRELALGLGLGDFIGAGIDLCQEVALVDQLAFGERDFGQLAADLGLHGDGGERGHGAERVDHDADIARRDRRRADRLQPARGKARIGWRRRAEGVDDHIGGNDEADGNGEAETDAQF